MLCEQTASARAETQKRNENILFLVMFGSLFTVVCALEVQLQKHEKEWPIIALKGSSGEKSGP